jgi:hypothetical protein
VEARVDIARLVYARVNDLVGMSIVGPPTAPLPTDSFAALIAALRARRFDAVQLRSTSKPFAVAPRLEAGLLLLLLTFACLPIYSTLCDRLFG